MLERDKGNGIQNDSQSHFSQDFSSKLSFFAFAKAKGESFPFAFALVSPRRNISTTLDTLRLHYRRNHFPDLFLLVVNILEHLFLFFVQGNEEKGLFPTPGVSFFE